MSVSNSIMYVTECTQRMVSFSFQGNLNAEERPWNKQEFAFRYRLVFFVCLFVLNRCFTGVEELLATNRIVLIMVFIYPSIRWAPWRCWHSLLQATFTVPEWCLTLLPPGWSSSRRAHMHLSLISRARRLQLCSEKTGFLVGLIGWKQWQWFFSKL